MSCLTEIERPASYQSSVSILKLLVSLGQLSEAGKLWQEVPAGGEYSFSWSPSDGYIGVVTKTETPSKTLVVKIALMAS